jgi:hypothetical protein
VYALRLAVGNLRTTEEHVRKAWEALRRLEPPGPPGRHEENL